MHTVESLQLQLNFMRVYERITCKKKRTANCNNISTRIPKFIIKVDLQTLNVNI